jgi:anti-anti-sigma factor
VGEQAVSARAYAMTVDGIAGVLVIKVDGELDLAGTGDLARCLRQAERGRDRILVDLGGVTFMDSAGLDVLLDASETLGERLELVVPPDSSVSRLLKLTGARLAFAVHSSAASAL